MKNSPLLAFTFLCSFLSLSAYAETPKHRFITADSSKQRIAIIGEDGRTEWEMKIGPLHDLHVLDNGNILLQKSWTQIVEVDPKSAQVVWQYDASQSKGNAGKRIEVHAFQRLEDGNTMIAESGATRILEVDNSGKIVHEVALRVTKPHPHTDTRLVRKLSNGNYLVCHESDGLVREYTRAGETAWEYDVPMFGKEPARGHGISSFGDKCFCAIRLANGNTLISTGNGHSVIEVTPAKEIAWKLEQNDLPGIQFAWVTTLQELPNGNIVIGNCHAEKENPQIVEVSKDKQVIWTFHDFERFGNATTNTQILSTDGTTIQSQPGSQR